MEPIAYANGSTLDDPAITYGIVFSNFMSKGVYIFQGGTDKLIGLMRAELQGNGVDLRRQVLVEKIIVEGGRTRGVIANGRRISAGVVLSNANLKTTLEKLVGYEHLNADFAEEAAAVRLNNSSCQVYIGIRKGEILDYLGELLFTSTDPVFDSTRLCAADTGSRTFSMYYPDIRPGSDRFAVVSSTNANWDDWAHLSQEAYEARKQVLIETTLNCLEKYIPDIRAKMDHVEAATPKTFHHYTHQAAGSTFGTKFEGLKVSMELPNQVPGLFHAGSVGIIMSGWLGTINYGVIVANEIDGFLHSETKTAGTA